MSAPAAAAGDGCLVGTEVGAGLEAGAEVGAEIEATGDWPAAPCSICWCTPAVCPHADASRTMAEAAKRLERLIVR